MTIWAGGRWGYVAGSGPWLASLAIDLAGTAKDQTITLTQNPAGQIATRTGANDLYAFTGTTNGARSYTTNGLDQYTAAAGQAPTWDARGNLATLGGTSYGYTAENRLSSVSGGATATLEPRSSATRLRSMPPTVRSILLGRCIVARI